jgi:hypothetical protein
VREITPPCVCGSLHPEALGACFSERSVMAQPGLQPFSRGSRPFVGLSLKIGKGSMWPVRQALRNVRFLRIPAEDRSRREGSLGIATADVEAGASCQSRPSLGRGAAALGAGSDYAWIRPTSRKLRQGPLDLRQHRRRREL